MSQVREVRSAKQAEQEDLFFGQTVIVWARWSVIVAGIVLVLWTSTSVSLLTQTMPFFLVLMAVNFFLHGRFVMGSPLNRFAVTVASVVDLILITAIVVLWPAKKPELLLSVETVLTAAFTSTVPLFASICANFM